MSNKRAAPSDPVAAGRGGEEEEKMVLENQQEEQRKALKTSADSSPSSSAAAAAAGGKAEERMIGGLPKVSRVADHAYLEEESKEDVEYMRGFGAHFSSEALRGALPEYGNTPKQ